MYECGCLRQGRPAGRKGTGFVAYYRRETGPGAAIPSNLSGAGVVVEGMFAEVHVYDNAAQVTANIDKARNLIHGGELINCIRVVSATQKTFLPPSVAPGPGGFAWAYDETFMSQFGRVNDH